MYVFGSRARGDHAPNSDFDVCLILSEHTPEIEATIDLVAGEVGFEHNRLITTVEFSRTEISHSALRASPLLANVLAEGVAV